MAKKVEEKTSFRLRRWEDQEKGSWRMQCKEFMILYFACLFWLWSILQWFEIAVMGLFPSLVIGILLLIYLWAGREGRKTLLAVRLLFASVPLILLLSENIRQEWKVLFHQISGILAEEGMAFWKGTEGEMRPLLVWICLGSLFLWIIFLFCESFVKNSVLLFFLVIIPVFFFMGRTGREPGLLAILFFVLFCLSMLTPVFQETLAATVLVLFLSLLVFLFGSISDSSESKGQAQWEKWKYQENIEILPSGDLTAAVSQKRGEDTALLVRMEKNSPYYLRGFVGSIYSDNAWDNNKEILTALEKGIVSGTDDLLSWLHDRKFYGRNQLSLLTQDSMNLERQTMQIENVGADRRFLYLPYECDTEISSYEASGIAVMGAGENLFCTGMWGRKQYQCSTYTLMAQEVSSLLASPKERNLTKEEEVYRQYVYQTCLALTKDTKAEISSVLNKKSGGSDLSLDSIVMEVRGWLKKQITYDTAPGTIPEGENFTHWFLKENKRGYDVQYASAAVMFFRYYGIPSRYVEGYLVTPEAIDQAQNGKETEVTVRTKDAHAWPEIYADGVGWIPIEVTQGYENVMPGTYFSGEQGILSNELQETESEVPKEETSDSEKAKQETQAEKEQQKEKTGDKENEREQIEESEEKITSSDRKGSSVISFPVFVCLLVMIFLVLFLGRSWQIYLQEKKIIKSDDKMAVCLTYLQLQSLVEYVLARREKRKKWGAMDNRTRTLMEKIKRLHKEVDQREMEKAFAIRQKAIYAPQSVTVDEKKSALNFFQDEKKYLYDTLSFYKKIRFFICKIFLVTRKVV